MSEISDDVYQPEGDPDQPGESIPDFDNAIGTPNNDEIQDTSYSPPERPMNSEEGETLEERLTEEEPEVWDRQDDGDGIGDTTDTEGEVVDDQVGDTRAGRLVAPDEGAHEDAETDAVASDVGIDGGAASAEEAAVHVVDEDRL
jgi:hypothetical protein